LLTNPKPSVEDLLVLGGREDKVATGRAGLRTVGGAEAVTRLAQVGNPWGARPDSKGVRMPAAGRMGPMGRTESHQGERTRAC